MKNLSDYLVDLSSEDEKIRLNAVIELGDSDDESAVIILSKFKTDSSSAVRFYVKKSLLKLQTKFKNINLDTQNELSDEVKQKIIYYKNIEKIKDRTKIEKLFDDFEKETDSLVKSCIVSVLGKLCNETHLDKLFTLTEHKDNRIVANAVEAIENINYEKSIDKLIKLLFHEDSRVKANVCKALWKFADKRPDIAKMVMARLQELVTSDKPWIRSSALYVLSIIKTNEAIELIKLCKNDPEKIIKDQANDILKKLGVVEQPKPIPNNIKNQIEELPPDDFLPKVKFYLNKVWKLLLDKYKLINEKISSDENFSEKIKKIAKIGVIFFIGLFFFIVTFNAIWELIYPPQPKMEVKKIVKRDVPSEFLEALGHLQNLNYNECINILEKEIEKYPNEPSIKKMLAVSYNQKASELIKNNEPDKALTLLDKALTYAPEIPSIYLNYYKILYNKDKPKAIEMLKSGLNQEPNNADLNFEYAKYLIANFNFSTALKHLQLVIEAQPANALAYYLLSECLINLNDRTLARDNYYKAISLDPSQYEIRLKMIDKFLEHDLLSDALNEISNLKNQTSKNNKLREKLVNIYFQVGNYYGAIDELKIMLNNNPNDYEINFKIALCYQHLDKIDEVFQYAYKAAKLNPKFYHAYYTLGSVYEYKKMIPAAKTCYEHIIKIEPNLPVGYVALAQLYLNNNQPINAIKILNEGINKISNNVDMLYHLMMAYVATKDNANAKITANKLLSLITDKESQLYKQVEEISLNLK